MPIAPKRRLRTSASTYNSCSSPSEDGQDHRAFRGEKRVRIEEETTFSNNVISRSNFESKNIESVHSARPAGTPPSETATVGERTQATKMVDHGVTPPFNGLFAGTEDIGNGAFLVTDPRLMLFLDVMGLRIDGFVVTHETHELVTRIVDSENAERAPVDILDTCSSSGDDLTSVSTGSTSASAVSL